MPARDAWLEGAETIERFRIAQGVTDQASAQGSREADRNERWPVEVELDRITVEMDPPVQSRGRGRGRGKRR